MPVESAATPPPPLAPPPTPQTSYQIIDPQVQSMDVQYWNNYTLASAPTTPTYVMSPHVLWSKGQFLLYASVERHVLGGSVWINSTERKNEVIEQEFTNWEKEEQVSVTFCSVESKKPSWLLSQRQCKTEETRIDLQAIPLSHGRHCCLSSGDRCSRIL